MRTKILMSVFLAAGLLVFGIRIGAQRPDGDQTQQDRTGQTAPRMMGGAMTGRGGMMGMMGQMSAHHQQMTGLMSQLMQSMTAILNEKDPAALKSKLAEHQKLLDQMRSQMMGQGNRINMMSGQFQQFCPGSNSQPGQSEKK